MKACCDSNKATFILIAKTTSTYPNATQDTKFLSKILPTTLTLKTFVHEQTYHGRNITQEQHSSQHQIKLAFSWRRRIEGKVWRNKDMKFGEVWLTNKRQTIVVLMIKVHLSPTLWMQSLSVLKRCQKSFFTPKIENTLRPEKWTRICSTWLWLIYSLDIYSLWLIFPVN